LVISKLQNIQIAPEPIKSFFVIKVEWGTSHWSSAIKRAEGEFRPIGNKLKERSLG